MAYRFSPADVRFLDSAAGDDALAAAGSLALDDRSLIGDLTRIRRAAGEFAGAVAETVRLRRRAVQRWGTGDAKPGSDDHGAGAAGRRGGGDGDAGGFAGWLYTDEALQQAAPPPVAAHRARRIAAWLAQSARGGAGVHDVTCSIGADLAALTSAWPVAIGSDIDPVRLAMARHNLTASGLPARLAVADARTVTGHRLLRYADPARRDSTGRRITSADTIPSVAELDAAEPALLPVLRLPPGVDYPALARPGEIEIVSLDGAVREAVAWPPALATVARRASLLTGDGIREQLTSDDPDDVPVTAAGDLLVDPDPAVVRAHLVRHYAARHRLTLLDPHLAYLTGSQPPPGIRSFRILDSAPLSERTVRGWARRDGVGTLEIKQRGTPVIPDELRRRLRLAGDTRVARTLVIARIGRVAQAFWCVALPPG
jgi:hypothetical protein